MITVDQTTNTGYFYFADNGTAAKDTVVTLLGSIELGTFVDADKDPIGNWQEMTLANFTPLAVEDLVTTFSIA